MMNMKRIVLFDGHFHQSLLPLTYTRPVSSVRVGIFTIKEKWEKYFGYPVQDRCKDYLNEKFNSVEEPADLGIAAGLLPDNNLVNSINELKERSILMKEEIVLAISPCVNAMTSLFNSR